MKKNLLTSKTTFFLNILFLFFLHFLNLILRFFFKFSCSYILIFTISFILLVLLLFFKKKEILLNEKERSEFLVCYVLSCPTFIILNFIMRVFIFGLN
jgi:hypothetical protein